jgi:RNA polymerase sigma factor for flagellar operon FliA
MKRATSASNGTDSAAVLGRFESELRQLERVARDVHGRVGGGAVTLDDVRGFGREGLLQAARSFDETRAVPFRRWARARMRSAMLDGLRRWSLSRHQYRRLRALRGGPAGPVAPRPRGAEGRVGACPPGLAAELAWRMGYSQRDETPSPEEALARAQVVRRVRAAVANLPARERTIVERCYFQGRTLGEAAAAAGVSKAWASRLRARALVRLSDAMRGIGT